MKEPGALRSRLPWLCPGSPQPCEVFRLQSTGGRSGLIAQAACSASAFSASSLWMCQASSARCTPRVRNSWVRAG
ncbi:Hypothetical protein PFR_JS8_2154 [Propionibacterium freudenreichii]|uniref:Uncharacterized protein n=1 Tax=Propionibacterium freudenreichii TaxID=1744 RepID=A0A509MJY3_9ACTN|nr:Hypothetical protein PFR_JS8_2154 [Propionibacterium freudenreichii]SCQ61620.1 Hypothetical protein PFR_JS15-1_138 [Propionibacterium freudenreichii]SCQ71307.1 Hypothetical protein PFR_JS15-2_138 [Propionibacterium freudenreichii]SCQ82299.1 Hypothetical protein PFR_JS23_2174 [Propionibacterium freudenreichii]